jgi:2-polyprenyl-3-methyl-5-hydroxy-6-metoxy-1,4-benzoquinol methylase
MERSVLYKALRDRVFFCAPGTWNVYRCDACGSGYLDPRPTRDSIGLAYRSYFTHFFDARLPMAELGWLARIRRALANGYRNHRFGTTQKPASRLGILAAKLLPSQRAIIETEGRQLPVPGKGARLLDLGSGNGAFLQFAQCAGWEVLGVEMDPKAVEVSRARGLRVQHGTVEALDGQDGQFDGITLSHVIEHVHDPLELLRACHRLLKPGGWMWLETPNLESEGHRRYGANWRGLEIPRHLVLFTMGSLQHALKRTGFSKIDALPYRPLCMATFMASEAITQGLDPLRPITLSRESRRAVRDAERKARQQPAVREFITLRAWKSGTG